MVTSSFVDRLIRPTRIQSPTNNPRCPPHIRLTMASSDDNIPKKSVLFDGEEADEEDEDLAPPVASAPPPTQELIAVIIDPSPYPQHNAGSSRYRNALGRVQASPTSDVEAWQALIAEVNACYRQIPSVHAVDAETSAQLDWAESCYGALLQHFPYAAEYYQQIVEMLLAQSARKGEPQGPSMDYGRTSRRAQQCEAKLEHLFRTVLGLKDDNDGDDIDQPLGGICEWSVELWLLYIDKTVRDARRTSSADGVREATKAAFETALQRCGFCHNNHLIWKRYLDFVRGWVPDPKSSTDHALAREQMQLLRSIYQRLVAIPMIGLDQLWQEYEVFERNQSEALAQALIADFLPKYQHSRTVYLERNRVYGAADLELGRLGTDPANESDDDYVTKMQEEDKLLRIWKTRCSYERTNPERLTATELGQRIRTAYKEMVCVLTRHPECWHMWSMWELHETKDLKRAIAVLQVGEERIPDCTLLAYTEANLLELHGEEDPSNCIAVLERFIERSPNTLAFVLYQQMVRRYRGKDEARKVFSRARRVLLDHDTSKGDKQHTGEDGAETNGEKDAEGHSTAANANMEADGSRWMVTNRLDASIAAKKRPLTESSAAERRGRVTWHLYASHAVMEHRLNRSPEVAARVYELGLRKHASFLTKPPYIMRYAQLLLELGDAVNLRALLTRAVAACEDQNKQGALAALWDMTLRFESVLEADAASAKHVREIERKRRQAVVGPDVEDVATGGALNSSDAPLTGAQKATISEQLVRAEGYDVSSSIVSGMSRTVDLLEIMGLWGNDAATQAPRRDTDEEISGGKSDASYHKRLQFQSLSATGLSADGAAGETAGGAKILSARERLQQGGAGAVAGQPTAIMLAIQQMPDWIRPLLLMLPASRLRLPIVGKPPPHLTELALTALRQNQLPAERPSDRGSTKRKITSGDDSSDDENGTRHSSGYGSAFRDRQRARMGSEMDLS